MTYSRSSSSSSSSSSKSSSSSSSKSSSRSSQAQLQEQLILLLLPRLFHHLHLPHPQGLPTHLLLRLLPPHLQLVLQEQLLRYLPPPLLPPLPPPLHLLGIQSQLPLLLLPHLLHLPLHQIHQLQNHQLGTLLPYLQSPWRPM